MEQDEDWRCGHHQSEHNASGKCRKEEPKDKDGVLTQQFILCDCKRFVPGELKIKKPRCQSELRIGLGALIQIMP